MTIDKNIPTHVYNYCLDRIPFSRNSIIEIVFSWQVYLENIGLIMCNSSLKPSKHFFCIWTNWRSTKLGYINWIENVNCPRGGGGVEGGGGLPFFSKDLPFMRVFNLWKVDEFYPKKSTYLWGYWVKVDVIWCVVWRGEKKNQATRTPWYLSAGPFQNFRRASPSFFTWETPPVPGTLIPAETTINLSPWVAA